MRRWYAVFGGLLLVAFSGLAGAQKGGWITLLDGTKPDTLKNWNQIGDANWRVEDGAVVADKGKGGMLVSKNVYKDFQIRAEFWAEDTTNSGIFFRAQDPNKIGAANSYEANIYDQRPDPSYGTGAIVNFAKVSPMPKAGGKWNTFLITAKGPELIVELNGVETARVKDSKYVSGPFALQYGSGPKGAPGGAIKWRKVEIRPL
jgi:hypothetical protein